MRWRRSSPDADRPGRPDRAEPGTSPADGARGGGSGATRARAPRRTTSVRPDGETPAGATGARRTSSRDTPSRETPGPRAGGAAAASGSTRVVPATERFAARARAARRRPRLLLAAVVAAVLLLALGTWVVRGSSLLAARDVEVVGASGGLASAVESAAAAPLGSPLAGVDLAAVGRRAATVPAVEKVTVARAWPHTLRLEVTPRVPVLAVTQPQGVRIVDAHGVAYATVEKAPAGVPVVEAAQTADARALAGAVSMMAALPADLRTDVSKVNVQSAAAMSFDLGGVSVRWGSAAQPELKVKVLRALLKTKPGSIDISAPNAPATS